MSPGCSVSRSPHLGILEGCGELEKSLGEPGALHGIPCVCNIWDLSCLPLQRCRNHPPHPWRRSHCSRRVSLHYKILGNDDRATCDFSPALTFPPALPEHPWRWQLLPGLFPFLSPHTFKSIVGMRSAELPPRQAQFGSHWKCKKWFLRIKTTTIETL